MDAQKAAEELKVIRDLMERPVRYSTQSGLSGVLAGTAAIAGCLADWRVSNAWADEPHAAMWINLCIWAAVFATAFTGVTILTRLRERRRGMPFWSSVKLRILKTILPPFLAGAGLTAAIFYHWYRGGGPNMWALVPPVWMLFYGVACWQVGEFSIPEIRLMGAAFIVAGLAAALLLQTAPYLTIGATFGGLHILYGIVVWVRHGG